MHMKIYYSIPDNQNSDAYIQRAAVCENQDELKFLLVNKLILVQFCATHIFSSNADIFPSGQHNKLQKIISRPVSWLDGFYL